MKTNLEVHITDDEADNSVGVETAIHCPGCGCRLWCVFGFNAKKGKASGHPYQECGGMGEGSCCFIYEDQDRRAFIADMGPDMDLSDEALAAFSDVPVPDLDVVFKWAEDFARHVLKARGLL